MDLRYSEDLDLSCPGGAKQAISQKLYLNYGFQAYTGTTQFEKFRQNDPPTSTRST
jgi:hypothetical protein